MVKHVKEIQVNGYKCTVIETDITEFKNIEKVIKAYSHHFNFQPVIITSNLNETYTNEYYNTFVLSKEYEFSQAIKLAEKDYCSTIFKRKEDITNIH